MKTAARLSLTLLAAILLVAQAPPAGRPTPEQRFFEWTGMDFPKEVYGARRERLAAALEASGGGVFLAPARPGRSHGETFRQGDDFFYFTGLEVPDAILAVDAEKKRTILFAPWRDARFESASRRNDFPGRPLADDPELARRSGIAAVEPVERFPQVLQGWVRAGRLLRLDPGRTGELEVPESNLFAPWSDEERLLHHVARLEPKARFKTAFPEVARLRMVKSKEEVATIRRAVEATLAAIAKAATAVRPGVRERTLEAEFEAECKRRGAQRLAFASIVKSGPNSLWPWRVLASHYDRRDRAMKGGELVIFDVGCELDHYASDIGRTFPVSGRFTAEQKRTLEMVTAVTDKVVAAVRPGVSFAELLDVAYEAIPDGEERYMQTGSFFGHHIGLDAGDPSLLEAKLEPGMVFTVEPWYYNHDREIAVFLEDNVLVTAEGVENLSRGLARTPRELERLMR